MSWRTSHLLFVFALLGIGANTQSAHANGTEVSDHLTQRWFEIELILFERLPVLEVLDEETVG